MSEPFRCSAARLERDEPLAGSATHLRAWLLLEHPGPWGVSALRDARLPGGVGERLRAAAEPRGIRPLLVRRPGRRAPREGVRVFAVVTRTDRSFAETTTVSAYDDVLGLDLDALAAGRSPGLTPHPDPLLLVCTHGRHDACCAERGRPVAAALAARRPELTWETSHVGGDRFAANLVVLPHGLTFGGVDPRSAERVVTDLLAGRISLDHLRGRCTLPMAAQAAEVALRSRLGLVGLDDVRPLGVRREGADTLARFDTAEGAWEVTVTTTRDETALLTCSARRENPLPRHAVVSIEALAGS